GVGHQAQGIRGTRCPKTPVGILYSRRAAAWRSGRSQYRQADDLRRGLSAPVPDGSRGARMKPVVVRQIARIDDALIDNLGSLGVSTVHEAAGRVGLMKPYMRPIWPGAAIAGSAVTVLAQPGDYWMI